jgi:hypothetical protein
MPAKESSAEVTQDARNIVPETTWMGEPSFHTAYVQTSHGAIHGQESEKPQDASKPDFPCLVVRARRGVFELAQIHDSCAYSHPFHSTDLPNPPRESLVQHGKPKVLGSGRSKSNGLGTTPPLVALGFGCLPQGPARSATLGKIMIMNYINGCWPKDCVAVDPRDPLPPNQKSMAQSRKERAA